ncbi:biliverdin-producing heme oxygenase [Rhodococcus hoagii]|nr:biliverdin-producing heme oxygenase [Prescottella equi]
MLLTAPPSSPDFVGDLLAGKLTEEATRPCWRRRTWCTKHSSALPRRTSPTPSPRPHHRRPRPAAVPRRGPRIPPRPGWRDQVVATPATAAYVARLEDVAFDSAADFVAHHYLRYMGDLSGGQIIRRMLDAPTLRGRRTALLHLRPDRQAKVFKDEYRANLDAAPLSRGAGSLHRRVNLAYGLNGALFADLEADIDRYLVK